jgi:hypothetical protein
VKLYKILSAKSKESLSYEDVVSQIENFHIFKKFKKFKSLNVKDFVSLHDELHYGEELHSVTTQIEVKSHIRNFIKKLLLSTNFKSFIKTYLVVRYIEYPIGILK